LSNSGSDQADRASAAARGDGTRTAFFMLKNRMESPMGRMKKASIFTCAIVFAVLLFVVLQS
jgi:hypothetical protein